MGEEFVGRTDELAAIGALLAASRGDRRVAVLVLVGEPGMGKSRLLDEAARHVQTERLMRFSGYEPESSVPLAAAAPLLRRLAALSEDRTFLGLLDPDADVGGLDAIRIFESAHRKLARIRPTALFIDDLQWVDPVSVALVHYLVRATAGSGRGLALVVASRPSPAADRFAGSIAAALGDGSAPQSLSLGPLDRADGLRFVASRGGAVARRDAVDLWERAGGSPFWLDVLVQAQGHDGEIGDAVATRLAGLTGDADTLLTMLAILARPIEPSELETVIGWPDGRTSTATTELVLHGLVVEDGRVVRIAHDLIRDAVDGRTQPAAQRRLHARIADALEAGAAGEVGGLLGALEHRAAAGTFDADLALRILRSPQRRLIGSDGVRRIAESARALDDSTVRTFVDQAAAALAAELGDQALALDRWAAVAAAVTDRAAAARAEYGAALAAYHLGRGDDADRWLERCRARAVEAPDLAIAADALEARVLLWLAHRTDAGRAIATRAVVRGRAAVADPAATRDVRAAYLDALIAAWEASIQGEHVDEVVALADESIAASRAMGLREVLEARAMAGMALEYVAHQQEAAALYRQVWDDAWRAVLPIEAVDVGYRLAAVLYDMLELDEAERIAIETDRLAARAGDQGRVRDRTRLVTYQLAMVRSDWQAAVGDILAAAEEEPDPHYRLRHHLAIGVWLARLGVNGDEALGHADSALALAAAAGCIACGRDVDLSVAEVYARFDRLADARDALGRWDSVGRRSWVESEWLRQRAAVLVASAAGPTPLDTDATLTRLRDEADRQGLGFNALWAELDLGRLLAATDGAGAVAAYRRAAERADASGAPTIRRLADQGLRGLGERPWRRGPTATAGDGLGRLSDREREVADLVALGATNAEIASRLFLSRKTVEHHVSNALAKLGLHSRAELAAQVGRSGDRAIDQDGAPPP